MRILGVLVVCLTVGLTQGIAKQRHCTFRVHAQANPQDTDVFSMSARARSSGDDISIQKLPWITERDVIAFAPYQAYDGTYGALFQLDEHGRVVLDTLSVERRGGPFRIREWPNAYPNCKSTSAYQTARFTFLPDSPPRIYK